MRKPTRKELIKMAINAGFDNAVIARQFNTTRDFVDIVRKEMKTDKK
jgi:hypothetical protein